MYSQIRFAPQVATDDDDLYSGYNDYHTAFDTKDLDQDEYLQEALRTSHGKRTGVYTGRKTPGTAMRLGTSSGYREGNTGMILRPVTGSMDPVNRPMTAVRGAGFTSHRGSSFDPLHQASTSSLLDKIQERPENKVKRLERGIMDTIDESCIAANKRDFGIALEKAKEASTKEKNLIRFQEQARLADSHNLDLTFLVLFNLASQYAHNEMYTEALSTYTVITRNRMFPNANQLKVNMANIYVELGLLPKAIKTYRMALDQVPNTHKDLRVKIMHNIGLLFMRMGQYSEACSSFEYIMQEKPDFRAGLHVILCYIAMGEKDKMKQSFLNLLMVPLDIDEDKYNNTDDPVYNTILEVIRSDRLRALEKDMRHQAEYAILTAAKLLAPLIDSSFTAGYNWCVEAVRNSSHESLAGDLEINQAIMHLKGRELNLAIDALKGFEKRDARLATTAATNLSFIHFYLGDYDEAEKWAEQARASDTYNAFAYVNLGNCSLLKGDPEKAKQLYLVALDNDSSCIQALYNLGLVYKRQEEYEEALECFLKLHAIVSSHPPVLYQLAHLHQLVGDVDQAVEWFLQLLSVLPADPSILQKLGEIYDMDNDKQQAYHYHFEAYRYLPSNLAVLDWLGAYFVTHRVAEKAIPFYERAALMQPNEPKWQLLIGSCHRRTGNYQQALATYKATHTAFPDNIECLKFLVRLCSDLGLKETSEYALELKRAEKAKELRERISSSRSGSRRSSGRSSRGGMSPGVDSPLPTGRRAYPEAPPPDNQLDGSYSDPLGPLAERPRTGLRTPASRLAEDEFADDEITHDLLPE